MESGRYTIQQSLGQGGMGKVFLAQDHELNRPVALKFLNLPRDPGMRQRFKDEADVLSKLSHPGLLKIYDFFEEAPWAPKEAAGPFFSMEFLEGRSLSEVPGKLSSEQALAWLIDLLQGLHYLHNQGIYHRDLKPSNLWITQDGQVKLLDFGLARFHSERAAAKSWPEGTLLYIAPEVFWGDYTAQSDLFSLGVLFYEKLGGRLPYLKPLTKIPAPAELPPPLQQLRPDLPEFLCDLIDRLCDPNPTRRPSTARTALAYLNQHLETPIPELEAEAAQSILEKVPLIGRESEWRALEDHFRKWGELAPSVWVQITGPAGVGRSRWLEEVKWFFQLRGLYFFSSENQESDDWWNNLLHQLNPHAKKYSETQILTWGREIFQSRPEKGLVLAFPDLQDWSESRLKTLETFLKLAEKGPGRLWIFLEYCDEEMNPALSRLRAYGETWAYQQTQKLSDLTPTQTLQLLRRANLGKAISNKLLKEIAEQSGGRPLLALEALRQFWLAQSKAEPGKPEKFSVPQNFRETAAFKMQTLQPNSAYLLALLLTHPADVLPDKFRSVFLGAANNFDEALSELIQKDFIRDSRGRSEPLRLGHPSLKGLYLEVLAKDVLAKARRSWLEPLKGQMNDSSPDEDWVAGATHAWGLGDQELVRSWALKAAEILARRGQDHQAIEWYRRLISAAKTPLDLSLAYAHLAPIYYRLGQFEAALEAYDQWIRYREDDPSFLQKLKHFFYTGLVHYSAGHSQLAQDRLNQAIEMGQPDAFPLHRPYMTRASLLLGALENKSRNGSKARELFNQALDWAQGDPMLEGEAEQRLGLLEQAELDYPEARLHLEKSLEFFRKAKNPSAQSVAVHAIGMLYREEGELTQAVNVLHQAIEIAENHGLLLQGAQFKENLGLALLEAGEFGLAKENLETAWEVLRILGKFEDQLLSKLHQIYFSIQVGNLERAASRLSELGKNRETLFSSGLSASFFLLEGELALVRGYWQAALGAFQLALADARNLNRPWEANLALWGWVRTSLRQYGEVWPENLKDAFLNSIPRTPAPLYSALRSFLEVCSYGDEAVPEPALLKCLTLTQQCQRPDIRRDLFFLSALVLKKRQQTELAEKFFKLAEQESNMQQSKLPEEFKMDFEKNRKVPSLDDALNQLLPPETKSEKAGTSTLDGIPEARFRQFSEINRQLAQRIELPEILERVMDAAIELTGAERGFLILKNENQKSKPLPGYEVSCARHLNQGTLREADFQFSMTAVQQAMERGMALLTDNAQLDPRLQERKSVVQFQLKSILAVPLEIDGRVFGAIYLDHRFHPGCFSDQDIVLLEAFAAQAALAIQKAQMVEELKRAKRQLEDKVEVQEEKIQKISMELAQVRDQLKYGYEEIVGQSPGMMQVFQLLDHVTETTIPVWVCGESGTGKELVARSLHFNSPRKEAPFVTENCSAIPETLLESELFGHKKGAFTHADRDRVGLFEQANRGTLFLDEIADMPMSMQVKLLRVLQEGEIRPLGSNKKVKIDVRLVTASNRDLAKLVKEGKFRQDLFFRINGLSIKLPPLRERKDDIPLLVDHMVRRIARDFNLQPSEVSDRAFQKLLRYTWPGNIRELEGVVRNSLLFAKGRPITPELIQLPEEGMAKGQTETQVASDRVQETSEERQMILEALRKHDMDKEVVAKELGISLRSLYTRMEKLNIPKKKTVLARYLNIS